MIEQPLISVIVPIYNVQKYLDQCIDTIINQTYTNLEIILVDDGSPDKCPEMCDEWAKKDPRIHVIHKKNGGLSDARNVAIDYANGKYLGFVDADDYISEYMYETLVNEAEKNQAQIACCGRVRFDENGNKYVEHNTEKVACYTSEEALSEMLRGGDIEEAAWDKLYLKALFEGIRYPVGEINEDIVTTPLLIAKAKKVVHVGMPLYYYRFVRSGITKSGYKANKHIVIDHIKWVREFVDTKHSELKNDYFIFQGRYCFSLCRSILSKRNNAEKYRDDYLEYKTMLRESITYLISEKCISVKHKLLSVLIILELYRPIMILLGKLDNI